MAYRIWQVAIDIVMTIVLVCVGAIVDQWTEIVSGIADAIPGTGDDAIVVALGGAALLVVSNLRRELQRRDKVRRTPGTPSGT